MSALSENRALLQAFVARRLSDAEAAALLEQLVADEEALAVVDALWDEQTRREGGFELPDLSTDVARSLERRLFNRLQRSELGGNTVRLGTEGFLGVLLAMLRPLFQAGGGNKEKDDA